MILNLLKSLYRKFLRLPRNPKLIWPDCKFPIVPVFELQGRTYYKIDGEANMNYERALKVITFYNEMNQRVDREYLIKHTEAYEEMFKKTQFTTADIIRMKQLNDQLKDRLNWLIDTDLTYKLASVVYFDDSEDPRTYDFEYNQKKIDIWKKVPIESFFLSRPISELVPYLKDYEVNLETYSMMAAEVKAQHLANLSQQKS